MPTTCPSEWDIYSSMPGSKRVNAAITKRAEKVAHLMAKASVDADVGPKLVMALVKKHISPVFDKYQQYGTYDTEPRAQMAWWLSTVAKEQGSPAAEAIYEAVRWDL
jgi:hypothetical protein